MTVRDFIIDLGGATKVAADLGVPMTTVHSWSRAGSVPSWRIPQLAALAHRKNIAMPAQFAERPA